MQVTMKSFTQILLKFDQNVIIAWLQRVLHNSQPLVFFVVVLQYLFITCIIVTIQFVNFVFQNCSLGVVGKDTDFTISDDDKITPYVSFTDQ